jgi:hypothetical protein
VQIRCKSGVNQVQIRCISGVNQAPGPLPFAAFYTAFFLFGGASVKRGFPTAFARACLSTGPDRVVK